MFPKNVLITGSRSLPQVLLVLENADALLERGGDARDRLVEVLASLCSKGDEKRLKLLVTSEQRLLPETHERFRDGSEVEAKVEPLEPGDATEFLIDELPRKFTKNELRLPKRVPLTKEIVNDAVQKHPELMDVIKEGHPGTLVRGVGGRRGYILCRYVHVCGAFTVLASLRNVGSYMP